MANEQNLIPYKPDDTTDKAKNGRLGGIASGKSKRRRRELREIFQTIRSTPVEVTMPDKTKKEVPLDEAAALAMFRKAMSGNVEAMRLIATMLGEYEQKVKVEGATPVLVTPEELVALKKWAKGDDEDSGI